MLKSQQTYIFSLFIIRFYSTYLSLNFFDNFFDVELLKDCELKV